MICDGIPVLVAVDKIRPCTAAELLAYQFMHGEGMPRAAAAVIETQQHIPRRERDFAAEEDED